MNLNNRFQMAAKIGEPGGPLFLQQLQPPGTIYQAYKTKILNETNPEVVSKFEDWVDQPAVQLEQQEWRIWVICLFWFYKKRFDSKLKLPERPRVCSLFEPVGEILHAILLLTEYVYLYGNKHDYTHHWHWFFLIATEGKMLCFDIPDTKSAKVEDLRKTIAALKDGINPFPSEIYPHFWGLIESAHALGRNPIHGQNVSRYLNFRNHKKRRYGLTYALSWWAGELDKNPSLVAQYSDENAILFEEGRGHGKRRITKAEFVNARKKQTLRANQDKGFEP